MACVILEGLQMLPSQALLWDKGEAARIGTLACETC